MSILKRLVLLLLLASAAVGCARERTSSLATDDFGPLQRVAEDTAGRLDGIWKSRGYGWVFAVSDGDITQYQVAGVTCFATPGGLGEISDTLSLPYQYFRIADDPDVAILQLLPDDTEIHIERINELPKACRQPLNDSYPVVLDYFASMMAEHYAFFERRQIDWQSRVATARSQVSSISTDQEFFTLLAGMLDGFSDSHTKLLADVEGERLRQQDGLGTTLSRIRAADQETPWMIGLFGGLQQNVLDPGSNHTARDRILWGTIDGEIGYIQILLMGGFSGLPLADPEFREAEFRIFDEVMDEALYAMRDAKFVVLDLSNNRGGFDAISRRLVSRFTSETVVAYQTFVPGSGVAARPRYVSPATAQRFPGPVLLLTSDVTVSGGELAVLGLRALPNVTHMGGTTRGSFSTVLAKPLPNGWVVELSNEVFSTADGEVYEESGIQPEFEFEMFPEDDPIDGYFRALAAAIERMRELVDH